MTATDPSAADQEAVTRALGVLYIALDAVPDPLHRLALLRPALAGLEGEARRTVAACREVAVPWTLIADALGLKSEQAAHYRYGRRA